MEESTVVSRTKVALTCQTCYDEESIREIELEEITDVAGVANEAKPEETIKLSKGINLNPSQNMPRNEPPLSSEPIYPDE